MTTRITPGVGANLIGQHAQERNQDATAYVGNLDPLVTEDLLWELFTQAGPVINVYVPKDRVSNLHQGYGFVEFRAEEDADYAVKIMNMIKLFGKPVRVNKASQDRKQVDIGANLFIGNLDPDVDEKLLYDTFSAFGVIANNPKIMRDPETGNSKGFGFVSFSSFEASDAAIEGMNGQYLCNRAITVSYAYKKDTKGERHGTPAERLLASTSPEDTRYRPHTRFASGPPVPGHPPQFGGPPMPPPPMPSGVPPPPPPGGLSRPPPPPGGVPPPPPPSYAPPPPPPPGPGSFPPRPPHPYPNGHFRPPPHQMGGPPGGGQFPPPPMGARPPPPPAWLQQQGGPPPGYHGGPPMPPGQGGPPPPQFNQRPPWANGPPPPPA